MVCSTAEAPAALSSITAALGDVLKMWTLFLLALETAQPEHIQLTFSDFVLFGQLGLRFRILTKRCALFSDVIAVTNLVVFVLNKKMFISLIGSVEKAKGSPGEKWFVTLLLMSSCFIIRQFIRHHLEIAQKRGSPSFRLEQRLI